MSVEMMTAAMSANETDDRLTTLEKLVLVHVAWRTIPGRDYEIRFRTLARATGSSRNGVKAAVRNLESYGYFTAVAVKVRPGPALVNGPAKGGQSVTPIPETKGGQSVTRGGSVSDPQKGQSVTPYKRKDIKGGAKSSLGVPTDRRRSPLECGGVDLLRSLSKFQREQLRQGQKVLVQGSWLLPEQFSRADFGAVADA